MKKAVTGSGCPMTAFLEFARAAGVLCLVLAFSAQFRQFLAQGSYLHEQFADVRADRKFGRFHGRFRVLHDPFHQPRCEGGRDDTQHCDAAHH